MFEPMDILDLIIKKVAIDYCVGKESPKLQDLIDVKMFTQAKDVTSLKVRRIWT